MGQGNVPISSLLDSTGKEQDGKTVESTERAESTDTAETTGTADKKDTATNPAPNSTAASLVAQFQTTIEAGGPLSPSSSLPLPLELKPRAIAPARTGRLSTNQRAGQLQDQLKSFQTNFRATTRKARGLNKIVFKPVMNSRASITLIINTEENNGDSSATPPPEKKRRAPKSDGPAKRTKSETTKKPTKAELKAAEQKTAELKKSVSKNKTPDLAPSILEKPGIHATMTVERKKWGMGTPLVPEPSILETGEGNLRLVGRDDDTKHTRDTVMPVIVLDVPLLDHNNPKPGQAEVVVHVMKLAEEKYGWNAVHPSSKSSIELLDEMLEDEEDGDDDDDEEPTIVDEHGIPLQKKKEEASKDQDKEKEKEKEKEKKKKKGPKVNRKVGKYDCDDPFIDDTELQWEEEITTTKEGFFVYWGPLVDERGTGAPRKIAAKNKK